jgi:methylated-DNA-protein-cysteine methyltransferase-like protein
MIDPAEAVYDFVSTVPPGKVVTYGQVAGMVDGVSLTPRQVGGIMYSTPTDVPWQRVVGAKGYLPIGKRATELMMTQRRILELEGVKFLPNDRIDMASHQWSGEDP